MPFSVSALDAAPDDHGLLRRDASLRTLSTAKASASERKQAQASASKRKQAQASASKRKQAQAVPWDVGLWARDAVRGEPSNGRRIQTGDQTVKFRPVCALFMQSCDSLYGLLSWRWLRAEPRPFSLENRSDRRLRERTTPEVSCC